MAFTPERRQQCVKATAVDHPIDLACTHGLSFASTYLRNQRLSDKTITRILFGPQDQHRKHECSGLHPELPYASELRDSSNTPVRQLSYSSRPRLGHFRGCGERSACGIERETDGAGGGHAIFYVGHTIAFGKDDLVTFDDRNLQAGA